MSAQQNKKSAEDAYRAFGEGDAAAAMEDIDDSIVWTVNGDSAITGTYKGKEEVAGLWGKLAEKGLTTKPHDFVADEEKVVVLTTVTVDGESGEAADILTYNKRGKLIEFEQLGDPAIANRVFAR
ncbi:MAG: nuclear transport factor 2 family protein [Solirubrobacterales bacterium]